jgi:hypothetical protein
VNNGASTNSLRITGPPAGAQVGGNFTLTGHTVPGAAVHVAARASAQVISGVFSVGTGTFSNDVTADGNGNFSVPITLNTVSGGQVQVVVTSTAPNGASVQRAITYGS